MIRIYYRIWMDAIEFERKNHGNSRGLMFFTLVPMSFIQGLNLFGILLILRSFKVEFNPFLNIDIFTGELLDKALSGIITMYAPFIFLNYTLIFYNKRFETLLEKYGSKSSKKVGLYYGMYFLISVLLIFIPIILFKWIS